MPTGPHLHSPADACAVNLRAVAVMVEKITMDLRSSQCEIAGAVPHRANESNDRCLAFCE